MGLQCLIIEEKQQQHAILAAKEEERLRIEQADKLKAKRSDQVKKFNETIKTKKLEVEHLYKQIAEAQERIAELDDNEQKAKDAFESEERKLSNELQIILVEEKKQYQVHL